MDIRNQQHTIFANAAKAQAFIAANIEDLMEGERYEIDQNPKGDSALVKLFDGDHFVGYV